MADAEYVRLAPACACGGERRQYFYAGEVRLMKACSAKCRQKLENKPLEYRPCARCGTGFQQARHDSIYCTRICKQNAWYARHPEWKRTRAAPKLCAWHTGYCERCGKAGGSKRAWTVCSACKSAELINLRRAAYRLSAEALHRAAAKETQCKECGTVFCSLYGSSHAKLCICCVDVRFKRIRKQGKEYRKALKRGANGGENVDPLKVFARDKWRCTLCGVKTPIELRGTLKPNAPELDHILPVSKGGTHTYTNTQCACRRCNSTKADKPLGQMLMFG